MKEFLNVEGTHEMPRLWSDDSHVYVLTRQEQFTAYTGTGADDEGEVRYRFDYNMYTNMEWQEFITQGIRESAVKQLDKHIDSVKANKVRESRELLEQYYADNPLFSKVHSEDGEYYSVTSEKQSHLTSMIALCEQSEELGVGFTPTWNATGKVSEPWTKAELQRLSLEIAGFVYPLVHAQQSYERLIQESSSVDEVNAIQITYGQ